MTKGIFFAVAFLLGGLALGITSARAEMAAWDVYGRGVAEVQCGERPVLLQGSHTDIHVRGPCRYVRVAGEHNDIYVTLAPRGTIEITGEHNDVWWIVPQAPGNAFWARPRLLAPAPHNTFHHGSGD